MEGDPDRPIITGRVYNGDNQPPYDMPSKKMYTGMKTRSYPDGGNDEFNELRFDDTKGSERIFFQAQKWMDIRVKQYLQGMDRRVLQQPCLRQHIHLYRQGLPPHRQG